MLFYWSYWKTILTFDMPVPTDSLKKLIVHSTTVVKTFVLLLTTLSAQNGKATQWNIQVTHSVNLLLTVCVLRFKIRWHKNVSINKIYETRHKGHMHTSNQQNCPQLRIKDRPITLSFLLILTLDHDLLFNSLQATVITHKRTKNQGQRQEDQMLRVITNRNGQK